MVRHVVGPGLAALLASAGEEEPAQPSAIQLQAQVMELREYEARWHLRNEQGCPFKAGQLVTPRPNSPYGGHGLPHLVLETMEPSQSLMDQNHGGGELNDMRVLHIAQSKVCAHVADSVFWTLYEESEE